MRNYLLRATGWVQLSLTLLVILLVTMAFFIDDKFYFYEKPATNLLTYLFDYAIIYGTETNTLLLLLQALCFFVVVSVGIGSLIGLLSYCLRKKKPISKATFAGDALLTELIFIAVLGASYLMIFLTHNFSFEIGKDNSFPYFFYTFIGCFFLFLLGKYLLRRNLRLPAYITLGIYGVALTFVTALSVTVYGKQDNFYDPAYQQNANESAHSDDESTYFYEDEEGDGEEESYSAIDYYLETFFNTDDIAFNPNENTAGTYDPFAFEERKSDYFLFNEPREYYKWNFLKFNRDFITSIVRSYKDLISLEYITMTIMPTGTETYDKDNEKLHSLTVELGHSSYKLTSFWYFFKNIILENMDKDQLLRYTTRARYLLKIYYLINGNEHLYEDIYDVMELSDENLDMDTHTDGDFLMAQLKLLKIVYTEYDIEELDRDLQNSELDYSEIRWAYSFWARRYKEENIPIVLGILLDVNAYTQKQYPKEYQKPVL